MAEFGPYVFKDAPVLDGSGLDKVGDSKKVTFPVSYRYNGLTEYGGKLYTGFDVPEPIVPDGCELRNMGILLQLNAHPPYATELLVRVKEKK